MSGKQAFQDAFKSFLSMGRDGYYTNVLSGAVIMGKTDVEVNFSDFYGYDPENAANLIRDDAYMADADDVIRVEARACTSPDHAEFKVRWVNLPETTSLKKVSFRDVGSLIQARGVLLRVSAPEQVPVNAVFRCANESCGNLVEKPQNQRWFESPDVCPSCGCRKFNLDVRKTTYRERQTIRLHEARDEVQTSDIPRATLAFLWGSLINSVNPGDKVVLTGVPDIRQVEKADPEHRMELFVTVNSIKALNRDEENSFTPEEAAEFEAKVREPSMLRELAQCIAPSIYGNEVVKEAIILELVSGVSKWVGGDYKRGNIHILLAGDASTGKTTLIRAASSLSPRGIFSTGAGSSRAGMTAAVGRDKDEGGWTLDAGAMVLADHGLLAIDEFDKMKDEDRGAMHSAMESQIVAVNKAGFNTVLNAETSVLAACNPKMGRWNSSLTLLQNLNDFPETLLSRFDLIFVFTDDRNKELEEKRAAHVGLVMRGEAGIKPPLEYAWVKRFLGYVRRGKPTITEEVDERIKQFYTQMKEAGWESNTVSITQRQQEALYRLAGASAKLHLRGETALEDAETAIRIMAFSLKQVGVDPETGKPDINALYSGIPTSLRDKLTKIREVVDRLSKSNLTGQTADGDMLVSYLEENWKMSHGDIAKLLNTAQRENVIYQPRVGEWKTI